LFKNAIRVVQLEFMIIKRLLEESRAAGLRTSINVLENYISATDRLSSIYIRFYATSAFPPPKQLEDYLNIPFRYLTKLSEFIKMELKKKTANDRAKEAILDHCKTMLTIINDKMTLDRVVLFNSNSK